MKTVKKIFNFFIYALGALSIICAGVIICLIAIAAYELSHPKPDRENSAEFSDYKYIFNYGGENSLGKENFDKILYSFESERAFFNGDGETFLKIRLKPEALNRLKKNPSKNPASTWIPGSSLNAYQKEAAEFAFNCYKKRLSPEFSERYLFYFRRIKSWQWSNIYIAEVLMYDTKEHILYYADTKI